MAVVAVTGGTGFVGANLVRRLVADGQEVHLLVRANHRPWRLDDVIDDLHVRVVDLGDRDDLAAVIRVLAPDQVFHLATHGAYPWQTDERAMFATNVVGTDNLVAACRAAGVSTLVHTGSSSEYGARDHAPTEDEAPAPNSYYALTKAWATLACQAAGYTTLRLYSVYGPWEDPRRFVPSLVEHGLEGRLPPLADPATARDFVYVDDVVDALLLAGAPGDRAPGLGSVYNVGTGVQTTLADAVDAARRSFGIEVAPAWGSMADRSWDTTTWVADPTRIADELGWAPRTSFPDGLRATVEWHRGQRSLAEQPGEAEEAEGAVQP